MVFGYEILEGSGVRFRLWASGAKRVDLLVYEEGVAERERQGGTEVAQELPMEDVASSIDGVERGRFSRGFFQGVSMVAKKGSRYAFRVDGDLVVPDPASRFQPEDVHGPSEVVDTGAYQWKNKAWRGRPWEEAIVYELHVGTFTREGTFAAAAERLSYMADLGITAVELLPVSDFPGARNWGYDGVLPYAPDSRYGRPEDLKALVDRAHGLGLMVLLDVVYNHFGPDGNYLYAYAKDFFTSRYSTPWGDAINFDGDSGWPVRRFFVENALYWLEEFRFDGLRLDAVHAIHDASREKGRRHILEELAQEVRQKIGRQRKVALVLENDDNASRLLSRVEAPESTASTEPMVTTKFKPFGKAQLYDAQWNDDAHHVFHHLLTEEGDGYYQDYVENSHQLVGRALAQGFVYTGQPSPFRGGALRGEPGSHLPPMAFVDFLQNHDQVGNRAFGDRIHSLASAEALEAVTAVWLLSPSIPLFFMGQEWGSRKPFYFFCDFEGELAQAIIQGRRREFAAFARFRDPSAREAIPNPCSFETFIGSKLDWKEGKTPWGQKWMKFHRDLLALRRQKIIPWLSQLVPDGVETVTEGTLVWVRWKLVSGGALEMVCNLSASHAVWNPQLRGEEKDSEIWEWIYRSRKGFDAYDAQGPGTELGQDTKLPSCDVAPWSLGVWLSNPIPYLG